MVGAEINFCRKINALKISVGAPTQRQPFTTELRRPTELALAPGVKRITMSADMKKATLRKRACFLEGCSYQGPTRMVNDQGGFSHVIPRRPETGMHDYRASALCE